MYGYVVLFVVALFTFLLYQKRPNPRIAKLLNKLPGHPTYPLIGTLYAFIGVSKKDIYYTILYYNKKYGPLYRSWMGTIPVISIMKPDHLEVILRSSTHINKSYMYKELHPWLGLGLLTSTGSQWQSRRKLLTPAFHFQILEKFMNVFVEKSIILIKQLSEKLDGQVFDIYPYITYCTLDIICETAMDVPINAMSEVKGNSTYINAIYRMCELLTLREVKPWLKMFYFPYGMEMNKVLKTLHNFSSKVINERKQALLMKNNKQIEDEFRKRRVSFLDILLEASTKNDILSDVDIREEVDTFMFEGHDTTTAGICWSLFLLGSYQSVQDKVYQEIKNALIDKKTPMCLADLSELNYLECVIKEALRLYPSVPLIARELTEDIHLDGYQIPSGCTAMMSIFDVHRDPDYWEDPDAFNPDRFLPENCTNRHPYSYIPFSAGSRNCIGQKFAMYEEKTILASILKNYKVKSLDNPKSIKFSLELILRPQRGIRVVLERRQELL